MRTTNLGANFSDPTISASFDRIKKHMNEVISNISNYQTYLDSQQFSQNYQNLLNNKSVEII